MAVSWTFPPPGHRGGAGNFPFLDNPFLVFALRRQFDRLQCMMSDSAFQQFAALARNLQLAREAGLLAGDRIRVYLRSPAEETTAKRGLARIIPIADDAMAKTAKAASGSAGPPKPALPAKAIAAKAGTETAKLLKDPLGQIVKEIQDKIPTLEAAAKTEDLGVKAAKNLVERAKVGSWSAIQPNVGEPHR